MMMSPTSWNMAFAMVSDLVGLKDSTGRIRDEYYRGLTSTNPGFEPVTEEEINEWCRYCCDNEIRYRPSLNEIKRFIRDRRLSQGPSKPLPATKRTNLGISQRFYMAILVYIKRGPSQFFESLVSGGDLEGSDYRAFLTGGVPPRSEVIQWAEAIADQFPDHRLAAFRDVSSSFGNSQLDIEIHDAIFNVAKGMYRDA